MKLLSVLCLIALFLVPRTGTTDSGQPKQLGLHLHTIARGGVWPSVPFGTIRLWDSGTRWHQIEPQEDYWNFEVLDKAVHEALERGADIVFTLGQTPAWAARVPTAESPYARGASSPPQDIRSWERYVAKLAQRYRGKIKYWEVWNEVDSNKFFSGTYTELAELEAAAAKQLRRIDPSNIVLSPSFQGGSFGKLERYLNSGGGRYSDIISYHFYTPRQEPETASILISNVKAILHRYNLSQKPIWNTEVGYLIPDSVGGFGGQRKNVMKNWKVLEPEAAKDIILRSFLINFSLGVERVIWYSWDHKAMGLSEDAGSRAKNAAQAFHIANDWMGEGFNQLKCKEVDEVWECRLKGQGHTLNRIVWTLAKGPHEVMIDGAAELHRTNGVIERVTSGQVAIGPSPVMITSVTQR